MRRSLGNKDAPAGAGNSNIMAGTASIAHGEGGPCANCGTERIGPYCHVCGQSGHLHRNLNALVHDIAHGVFHFEGKVWRTLPLLAWHPGRLTRRYVDGERAKFVSPMALFLFSVFLMFAVVSNLSSHRVSPGAAGAHINKPVAEELAKQKAVLATLQGERAKTANPAERAILDRRIQAISDDMPGLERAAQVGAMIQDPLHPGEHGIHINTGWSWFDQSVRHMSENPALTIYKFKTYGYKYSWALIPISLPFIWLLFAFRRDVGLYDHAIFAIYSISFMSLGVVLLTLLGRLGLTAQYIAFLAMLVPPIHMYRQLKGAYRLGRFGAAWRTFALLVITTITLTLFVAFLFWMGSD